MASEPMIFGLAERHYNELVQLFKRHPGIEQVLIFGSRAKGTSKPYSDIDLAVIAPTMDDQGFSRLWQEVDDLPLVFKIDVLHWDRLDQLPLKEKIITHGQYFYPRSMERLLRVREAIHDHFEHSSAGPEFFFKEQNRDRYAAFYTSKYLLQDTGEALRQHRGKGFSKEPPQAYLEFWGVMQTLCIQQEAICALYQAVTDRRLKPRANSAWARLRQLRNQSAGHPAKRDRNAPLARTFMGRNFGDYPAIVLEEWNAGTGQASHPRHNLAVMMDAYEKEAVGWLQRILEVMKQRWPVKKL